MLTEKQYQALCKYRDSFVPAFGKPDDMTLDFLACGFICVKKVEYTKKGECLVFYQQAFWELTAAGKLAIEEFEDSLNKMIQETANNKTEKAIDRKFQTKQTILNAVVCAIVSALLGLIGSHFTEIVSFLSELFQWHSPP